VARRSAQPFLSVLNLALSHATEFSKLGRIPVLKARMNADLHMADDLKKHRQGQSIRHLRRAGHHHCQRERLQVALESKRRRFLPSQYRSSPQRRGGRNCLLVHRYRLQRRNIGASTAFQRSGPIAANDDRRTAGKGDGRLRHHGSQRGGETHPAQGREDPLVLEPIGADKVRATSTSCDHEQVILPDQARDRGAGQATLLCAGSAAGRVSQRRRERHELDPPSKSCAGARRPAG
jgi:hypothetical protein